MMYNYYEILLLITLMASLVLKISKKLFNMMMFLGIMLLLVVVGPANEDVLNWESIMKIFCMAVGIMVINFNKSKILNSSNVLTLCVVLASTLLLSSTSLLALYLCIELQSLSMFVLMAQEKEFAFSIEASLKYFVLSSMSSGLFLLGSSLLFIHSGNCEVATLVDQHYTPEKILILVSLLFKLAASPFHFWSPDVYQGSNNSTLLLLGTLPKISILGMFIILFSGNKLLLMATMLSLIVGCIGAMNQSSIKSLLAYSSMVGMGFILLGMNVGSYQGMEAGTIYMFIYMISFISILITISKSMNEKPTLGELSNLLGDNLILLSTFGVLMLSVAGMPPLGGFLSKWLVLTTAMTTEFMFSSVVSILCAIMAGVYYVSLVKVGYFQEDKAFLIWKKMLLGNNAMELIQASVLGMSMYFVLFMLVCPGMLWKPMHYGVLTMF